MRYLELIQRIEEAANAQPSVSSIVRDDVYLLNAEKATKYGVFAWTQNTHRAEAVSDMMYFSFNFYYIDRLAEGDSNKLDIYATGIATLANIIRKLSDEVGLIDSYTLQPFTQKFLDRCAGVYATVSIGISVDTTCPVGYGDFNNDFNNDFFI